MFTYSELMTISQALIDAIDRCNQASHMVNTVKAKQAIDAECVKLQELNDKVCDIASKNIYA